MSLSIRFPQLDVPREAPLLAVRPQRSTPESVVELARRMGIKTKDASDSGLWLVSRDRRASLEVYQATASFRYSRTDLDGEARESTRSRLTAERARSVADDWMKTYAPSGARYAEHSITEHEVLVAKRGRKKARAIIAGLDVNYRFTFDGIPLLGPGAKAKVAIHHTGIVAGAYRFWRDVTAQGRVPTLSADTMFDRFRSSPLFADLNDRNARAEVRSARFGYLCLPPTETMSLLVPAVEIRGTIATEIHPRYDFVSYVGASEVNRVEAKRAHLVNAQPALLVA